MCARDEEKQKRDRMADIRAGEWGKLKWKGGVD